MDVDVNPRQRAVYKTSVPIDTYLGRNEVRRSIVLALLAAGCGSDSVLTGPDPATGVIPTVVVAQLNASDWKTDPLDIREAVIAADALRLWVAYGGGCEPHTFAFVVSSDLIPRLESGQGPPVETDALIAHDAHGDICERLVQDTLVADLTALKQAYRAAFQAASGAVVMIFDAETHVRYEF